MLELHQFRHSAFCLKVRMALSFKKLSYRVIEISPGVGQVSIFRLSGQRQVPLLIDGEKIVHDSTTIISHLDNHYPNPKLIPTNPKEAAQVHIVEDWADTTLANAGRLALLQAASSDPELRIALLPEDIPSPLKKVIGRLPFEAVNGVTELLSQGEKADLLVSLEKLSKLVETSKWLVGNSMSSADLAVAAQLSLLKFPASSEIALADKGCTGFLDHPQLEPLFQWRDELELSIFKNGSANN